MELINQSDKSFWPLFLIPFLLLVLSGPISLLPLSYFSPLLIFCYYRKSKNFSYSIAFFLGLMIDLISSHPLGIYTFSYSLTTKILWPQKRHFFEDQTITYPMMSALFHLISLSITTFLLSVFDSIAPLSFYGIFTTLIVLPFLTMIYTYLLLVLITVLPNMKKSRC